MVAEPELVVRLTRLRTEVQSDRAAMQARADEAAQLIDRWDREGALGRPEIVLLAVNLHGWYTALEAALERIGRLLDQSVPEGESWHADLVAQMQLEVPGVRRAVIPKDVDAGLRDLRRFRHFFRNAYVLDLDPTLVRQRATDLFRVRGPVAAGLAALETHLRAAIDELAQTPVGR
jgi:hypothetical protein